MIHGIFHGDLHGGNLFVLADGRIGLLDFGITARMTPLQRNAFLRLMLSGAIGDIPGQLVAFRDLGALPRDTDLDEVIRELGLDQAPVDPTTLDQDELLGEIQRVIKALLGYGARLPKILMLYVKNLVFLDGAIAMLAPDLDLLGEFADRCPHGHHARRTVRGRARRRRRGVRRRPRPHQGQLRHRRHPTWTRSPTATSSSGAT